MQIDPNLIPTTLDLFHLVLAGLAGLFFLLALLCLLVMIPLARRRPQAPAPVAAKAPVAPPAPVEQPKVSRAPEEPRKAEPVIIRESTPDAAFQVLGLLQKEARFIDFVQEDLSGHADADIGAVVRVVHEGCRKVLKNHFDLVAVRTEAEGTRITLPKGFDASAVRVSGNIVGEPPFTGTLIHRGWRAAAVNLPRMAEGHDARILTPAEVEL